MSVYSSDDAMLLGWLFAERVQLYELLSTPKECTEVQLQQGVRHF